MSKYPYNDINGNFLDEKFLKSVEDELIRKAWIWKAGILKPTPVDAMAFHVLNLIKRSDQWGSDTPQ